MWLSIPHRSSVLQSAKPRHSRAVFAIAKAAELQLVHALHLRQQRANLRDRRPQSLRILRADEDRKGKNIGQTDQQLRIAYQPLFFKNRREQFLLNIDHRQSTDRKSTRLNS